MNIFQTISILFFSLFLILFIFNLLLFPIYYIKDNKKQKHPFIIKYGIDNLKKIYSNMTSLQIEDILEETWSRKYIYESFTQFREREFSGKYININNNGFRENIIKNSWPINTDNYNIFVLGGSSVFGHGVSDNETISSYMQNKLGNKDLPVSVYNFGRSFYYSTQERILFEQLLINGNIPNEVIFLDGLNEFCIFDENPRFFKLLTDALNGTLASSSTNTNLPIIRAGQNIKRFFLSNKKNYVKNLNLDPKKDIWFLNKCINRYLWNKKTIELIASYHKIKTLFIWQPIQNYNYSKQFQLFCKDGYGKFVFSSEGYNHMREKIKKYHMGQNFLWLADIQENISKPLYVDKVHYSAEFNNIIADHIVKFSQKYS